MLTMFKTEMCGMSTATIKTYQTFTIVIKHDNVLKLCLCVSGEHLYVYLTLYK